MRNSWMGVVVVGVGLLLGVTDASAQQADLYPMSEIRIRSLARSAQPQMSCPVSFANGFKALMSANGWLVAMDKKISGSDKKSPNGERDRREYAFYWTIHPTTRKVHRWLIRYRDRLEIDSGAHRWESTCGMTATLLGDKLTDRLRIDIGVRLARIYPDTSTHSKRKVQKTRVTRPRYCDRPWYRRPKNGMGSPTTHTVNCQALGVTAPKTVTQSQHWP